MAKYALCPSFGTSPPKVSKSYHGPLWNFWWLNLPGNNKGKGQILHLQREHPPGLSPGWNPGLWPSMPHFTSIMETRKYPFPCLYTDRLQSIHLPSFEDGQNNHPNARCSVRCCPGVGRSAPDLSSVLLIPGPCLSTCSVADQSPVSPGWLIVT